MSQGGFAAYPPPLRSGGLLLPPGPPSLRGSLSLRMAWRNPRRDPQRPPPSGERWRGGLQDFVEGAAAAPGPADPADQGLHLLRRQLLAMGCPRRPGDVLVHEGAAHVVA